MRIGRDAEAAVLSESAAWLLMRRVVFASDDPRLEVRGEAVRTIIDGALRIARDGVDNLVDLDRLASFPEEFARVLELPSTNARTVVYADVAEAAEKVGALSMLADLARAYDAEKRRLGVIDFSVIEPSLSSQPGTANRRCISAQIRSSGQLAMSSSAGT